MRPFKFKHLIPVFLMIFMVVSVHGQDRIVKGTVTDERGDPMIGVNVVVTGTSTGTVTDIDGKFELRVPADATEITIRYLGYEDQVIDIAGRSGTITLNITMKEASVTLNPVTVSASKRKEKILDAPASVTILSKEKLETNTATTVVDHMQYVPGVDRIQTGLISSDVNLRGFNNIFSGAMLTIVDDRIARVPSLRFNAYQLIPSNNYDIERIEIVRGPGSALYGPNAANGVLAMYTRSPLDLEEKFETTISMTSGIRAKSADARPEDEDNPRWLVMPEFWHGGKITDKIGYKISGSYFKGHEFEFYDDREPDIGDTLIFGSVRNGGVFQVDTTIPPKPFKRNFEIEKYNADGRLEFRFNPDLDLTLNAGFARTSNIELTGLGAAQGKGWIYTYAQTKLRWKQLFFQYFLNKSNAGETYLIPQVGDNPPPHQVQLLVDKSELHAWQLQHSTNTWRERLNLIYGLDVLFTRPQTEGTINGRFEDEDNTLQAGVYAQGELDVHEKVSIVAAARGDYHNHVENIFFSPRAALVYKPTTRHTLRATYNRAFSPPSSLNLFLDLSNALIPNGINIRGIGNPDGYHYDYDDAGLPKYISPYTGKWYSPGDNSDVDVFFDGMIDIVAAGLASQAPPALQGAVTQIVNGLFRGIAGDTGTINNVSQVIVDYIKLNETGDFSKSSYDISTIKDIKPIDNSYNQTWELGYKGIIKDKLFLSADLWVTKASNFVSPLILASASVMFNPADLRAALGPMDSTGLLYQNLQPFDPLLVPLLDGSQTYGGVQNGTVYDELVNIIMGAAAAIPNGTITPVDDKVGSDIILTYVNLGDITYGGLDLGFNYLVTDEITISGAYSFVNKDRFELEGAEGGYVALNAPKNKVSAAFEYKNKKYKFGGKLGWRWLQGFPANSAIYIGEVEPAHYVDLNLNYELPVEKTRILLSMDIKNLLNNQHKQFVGTPPLGTIALLKAAVTF